MGTGGPLQIFRRIGPILLSAGLLAGLVACGQGPASLGSAFDGERVFSNLAAREPKPAGRQTAAGLVPVPGGVGVTQTFTAEDGDIAPRSASGGGAGGSEGAEGSYTLNFDAAPLSEVVRAIMTNALQLNYSVAADLSTRVTISSARPVRRDELLAILENLLSSEGYALNKASGGYRIEPSGTGGGVVDRGDATPGYGISIVPLRFVSVDTINTILSGFIATPENLRVSTAQNAVIIRGSSDRRQEAVEAVLSFDADWMKGQTVSIFELRRGDARGRGRRARHHLRERRRRHARPARSSSRRSRGCGRSWRCRRTAR